jgi:hypothetical protein
MSLDDTGLLDKMLDQFGGSDAIEEWKEGGSENNLHKILAMMKRSMKKRKKIEDKIRHLESEIRFLKRYQEPVLVRIMNKKFYLKHRKSRQWYEVQSLLKKVPPPIITEMMGAVLGADNLEEFSEEFPEVGSDFIDDALGG